MWSSWPEAMKGRLNCRKKRTSRIQNQSYTYKWLHYSILHVNCDRRWKWFGWNNYTSISLSPRLTILKISWGPEEIKLKLMSTEFQTWNCMKVLYIVCTPGDRFMWNNSLPILNKTTSCHKSQIPLLHSQTDCEFFCIFPKRSMSFCNASVQTFIISFSLAAFLCRSLHQVWAIQNSIFQTTASPLSLCQHWWHSLSRGARPWWKKMWHHNSSGQWWFLQLSLTSEQAFFRIYGEEKNWIQYESKCIALMILKWVNVSATSAKARKSPRPPPPPPLTAQDTPR